MYMTIYKTRKYVVPLSVVRCPLPIVRRLSSAVFSELPYRNDLSLLDHYFSVKNFLVENINNMALYFVRIHNDLIVALLYAITGISYRINRKHKKDLRKKNNLYCE